MVKEIKQITNAIKNGAHESFVAKGKTIYVYEAKFKDETYCRCGSIESTPKFEEGEKVEVKVLMPPKAGSNEKYLGYLSLKKFNETFNAQAQKTPATNDNHVIAAAAVTIGFNVYSKSTKVVDLTDPDAIKVIKKISVKAANIIIEMSGYLDSKNK